MLGKAIKMNLDDMWPFLAIEGVVFLLYEIIEAIILFAVKPDTSGAVCGMILMSVGVMANLFAGIFYPNLNVDMLLRYSVTRKTALLGTLGTMTLNMAVTMAAAALLGWADSLIAKAWVNALPWVTGVETVGPPVWAYFAFGLVAVCIAFVAGAVLQKFGRKAFWLLWGLWMVLVLGMNIIDWHVLDTLNLSSLVVGAAGLSVASLVGGSALILRANVKN